MKQPRHARCMLMIHQSTRELFLADVTQSRHGFDFQALAEIDQNKEDTLVTAWAKRCRTRRQGSSHTRLGNDT